MSLRYKGIAYRQATDPESPWIASFVAKAEDLLRWAAIPRRSEAHLLGFQRAGESSRIDAAREFFSISTNQSPTSLILGLHPEGLNSGLSIEFSDTRERNEPTPCTLIVDVDAIEAATTEERAERVRQGLLSRLQADSPRPSDEDTESDDDILDDDDLSADEVAMQEEPIEDREVELGESVLAKLADLLKDPQWVSNYSDLVGDLAKPATIIDGQHRVLGAAQCERGIPFNVCALINCSWPEQVFQFTVVNYTATGIPDQFITANAALSLTGSELRGIEARLVQAGVKVVEYELMKVVNFDQRSPFLNLVNLTEARRPELIGYKSMVRLAKAWQTGKADAIASGILDNLYPENIGSRRHVRRRNLAQWQRADWGDFFIAFWRVVHDIYAGKKTSSGHSLWDPEHSQLMIAAVLIQLQSTFLEMLAVQASSFFDINSETNEAAKEELLDRVRIFARSRIKEAFPPKFFEERWGTKSLSTGAGKRDLEDVFSRMVKSRGKFQYAKSSLVQGKAS